MKKSLPAWGKNGPARHIGTIMALPSQHLYETFTENGFIQDPFFQDWVLAPDAEKETFWHGVLKKFPPQQQAIENAKAFLQQLRFAKTAPDDAYINEQFAAHQAQVRRIGQTRVLPLRNAWKVAAFIGGLLLLASGIFYLYNKPRLTSINTQFGELKELRLPDSTAVFLAAHSTLQYKNSWRRSKPREIWLDGEAYFNVRHLNKDSRHIKPDERFIVHGTDVTVEVLGTAFNVRQRRGKTEVVLEEGSIRLVLNDSSQQALLLQPGDLVTYDGVLKKLTHTVTVPQNYTAWKKRKLLLNNPTVAEILLYLEDNFGKKLVLNDSLLLRKKIEGPILLNNLNDALFVLSTVLDTDIEQSDSLIQLKPRRRS